MKLLFNFVKHKKKHWMLITLTFVCMCFLTVASQLEVVSLGILAQKGPEFFELFGPIKHRQLQPVEKISKQEMEARWDQIDRGNKGYITQEDSLQFMSQVNRRGLVDKVVHWVNGFYHVSGNAVALASLFFIIALIKAFFMFWHRFTTRLVAIRVSRDLRQDFFEHIQLLPMSFYQKYNIGTLSSRVVSDAFLIAEGINATLINYFETPFTIVTTLALCFVASWKLSIFIFLGFPLIVYPVIMIARKVKKIARQLQKNQENFSSVLIDFLAGIQTVKVFRMEAFSLAKYREQNDKMAELESKSAKYDVSSRPVVHTIGMFFLAGGLIFGLYVLDMSIPEVLVYCGLLYVFYEPVKKFAEYNMLIQRGVAAAERMDEVMKIAPLIQDKNDAFDIKEFNRSIEFDNVWFKYEDEWVLKGLSFTVEKGQTVAIVGPTGSGKSTIVQLLPRLYDVQQGEIRIDGRSIKEVSQSSLRDLISFVPQKPFLFLDTIKANITYGNPFTDEKIDAAAEMAFAKEFIVKLPQKYETPLSETGKNLSGGQQQRLAIARALIKKSPILVMDEATSSLDNLSENRIKEAIDRLHGKLTQIIIAHRLTTIENADKIIYLDQGDKIAEGTRDELLQTCPDFRRMWEVREKAPV